MYQNQKAPNHLQKSKQKALRLKININLLQIILTKTNMGGRSYWGRWSLVRKEGLSYVCRITPIENGESGNISNDSAPDEVVKGRLTY